jgi:circadian clock protein KaiC
MNRISTGNAEADLILGGGFPRASINIIMGLPGTGKTIFAEQLAFANASSERPVVYLTSLSEPLAKIITYLQNFRFFAAAAMGTRVLYQNVADEISQAPENLPEHILRVIQEQRPGVIVVDSFKALSDLMPDTTHWRRVLYELAGTLSAYDVVSFWVGEYVTDMIARLPEFAVVDGIVEFTREQQGSRDTRYMRVVKLRGSNFRDGLHAFRINETGLEIYPRLITPIVAPEYRPMLTRLPSGIAGLDEMVETGFLRGTGTVVLGRSGAGKTVLGLHFLQEGVNTGEPGLLINFQENPVQLARIVRGFGWNPEQLFSAEKLDVLYTSPVELQMDTVVGEIFRRIERNRVQRVVIDALGDLQRAARDSQRFREYVYALSQNFAARNITTLFIMDTKDDESSPHGDSALEISSFTDNTLLLEMMMDGDLQRTVRIIKTRGSAHDGRRHRLNITSSGIVVKWPDASDRSNE